MTRTGRKISKTFPAEPNYNHLNPLVVETPVYVTAHQQAQAEFKERQRLERLNKKGFWDHLATGHELGSRGSGREGRPRPMAKHEAKLAQTTAQKGDNGIFREPVLSASVETMEAFAAPQHPPELNIWDLAKPGRLAKRGGYAAEPSRQPNTIDPTLLYCNMDDYIFQDLSEELLAQLFPSDGAPRAEEMRTPTLHAVAELEEDGWEFAAASEFSFDEVSLVDLRA